MAGSSFLGALTGGFGGSTLGAVLVEVGLDTHQLDAGLAKTEAQLKATGGSMSTFGKLATAGFAIAAAAAVKFGIDAVRAAEEHQKVLAQLKIAIGGNTTALQGMAAATADATGFTDDQILSLDTVLTRFDLSKTSLAQVTTATLDYARATGIDAVTAAQLLGRASLGNARALKSLGIQFTATHHPAKDFATVVGLVEEKTKGAAAAFAGTFAGKVALAGVAVDRLKIQVGEALLPSLSQLVTQATAVAKAITPLVVSAFQEAASTAHDLGNSLQPIVDILNAIPHPASDSAHSTSTLGEAFHLLAVYNPVHLLSDYNAWLGRTLGVTKQVSIASVTYAGTTSKLKDVLGATANQESILAFQERQAAAAAQSQLKAEKELAGGLLGLVTSLSSVRRDQAQLNDLRSKGKQDTKDYRDQEVQLLQDVLSLRSGTADFVRQLGLANATTDTAREKVAAIGRQWGLSQADIARLTKGVLAYVASLSAIPANVQTVISTSYGPAGPHPIPHIWSAAGYHGWVAAPTMFTAGEAGPERVDITPRGQRGGGSTFNLTVISPTDPVDVFAARTEEWARTRGDWV